VTTPCLLRLCWFVLPKSNVSILISETVSVTNANKSRRVDFVRWWHLTMFRIFGNWLRILPAENQHALFHKKSALPNRLLCESGYANHDDLKAERLAFFQDINQNIEDNSSLLNLIFFQWWSSLSLEWTHQQAEYSYALLVSCSSTCDTHQPLSQEKVALWCAIGRNGIIRSYFFWGPKW